MLRGRRIPHIAALVLLLGASLAGKQLTAQQVRFAVDSASSLAWWQIDPNYGYLWATTCPEDSSWQPGASHSGRYHYEYEKDPIHGRNLDEKALAATPVPVYFRHAAQSTCTPSVRGEITVADSSKWKGVRGLISIRAANLITGLDFRDDFARKRVLQADAYPEIRFVIDSVVDIEKGDTIRGTAIGKFELHGATTPWGVPLKAWHEASGLRVTAQFAFPAKDLVTVYGLPRMPLGLGVGASMWKWFHLGIDAVLADTSRTSTHALGRMATAERGKLLFLHRSCSGCHAIGKGGDMAGPDLKGVTQRRSSEWLTNWLKSPSEMIKTDSTAKALYVKYHRVKMPNVVLSDDEIAALLMYLDAASTDAQEAVPNKAVPNKAAKTD